MGKIILFLKHSRKNYTRDGESERSTPVWMKTDVCNVFVRREFKGSHYNYEGKLSDADDTLEYKFRSLWEEIMQMRFQSQTQLRGLTDEIKRLEKQIHEQENELQNLLEENIQFRQQLRSSMTAESLISLNYVDDGKNYTRDSTVDVANTTYRRVSELILIFENKQKAKSTWEDSDITDVEQHKHLASQCHRRKQLISDNESSYTNSINSSRDTNTDELDETVNQQSYHRLSELRAAFETDALNEQRGKSGFDIPDLAYHQQQGELHDECDGAAQAITDDGISAGTVEFTPPINVSHLRTVFETDGVSRQRVEYRWSDPKIVNFKEHQNLAAELDCDKSEKSRVFINLDPLQEETFLSEATLTVEGK